MNYQSNKADKNEVESYLIDAKNLLQSGDFDFVSLSRQEYMGSLSELGITIDDAEDVILNLDYIDYYSGPVDDYDKDRDGYMWVFKKTINDIPAYIKLKIDDDDDGVVKLKCISFHKDKYPSQPVQEE